MEGIPQGTPLISELTLQRTITEVQLDNLRTHSPMVVHRRVLLLKEERPNRARGLERVFADFVCRSEILITSSEPRSSKGTPN